MPRKGRKVRVDFRPNRNKPGRESDWTRQYHRSADETLDADATESVRAKGDLSRKRTIIVDDADAPAAPESAWTSGTVTAVHGRVCRVDDANGREWQCTIRRILRTRAIDQRFPVACGDRVRFSPEPDSRDGAAFGVIERVEPRATVLSRRESRENRGREHVVFANAEQLVIVSAIAHPRFKPHLIDRYLVAAGKGNLRPIVCFSKSDLDLNSTSAAAPQTADTRETAAVSADQDAPGSDDDMSDESVESGRAPSDEFAVEDRITADELAAEYRALGYTTLRTSASTGDGLDELRRLLKDRVTIFAGQSGVGKSSLINALQPGLNLTVLDVSAANEKGRHATTFARLMRLDSGGYVVDTPGIRQFDIWKISPGELEAYFIEFPPHIPNCRFRDCLHSGEEGCAVEAAVDAGKISQRRYLSYVKMLGEM